MGTLILLALVAVGAYVAWKKFGKKPAAPVAQSNAAPAPVSNTTSTKV
jgi:hypothetical protein